MTATLTRNHVQVSGSGETPLVFAHGFGSDQSAWRLVAPAFEDTHRVVLFDFMGARRLDQPVDDAHRYDSLQGYATEVLEVLDALALQQVIFVGHSVAATIGMLASTRRPSRFASLVLMGATPCYLNDPPSYFGGFEQRDIEVLLDMMDRNLADWAGALAPLAVGDAARSDVSAELEATIRAADAVMLRRFADVLLRADHRLDVPLVPVPAVILQCANDALAPTAVGEWLARHLPRNEYVQLDAKGHMPHLTHPLEVIGAIRRWCQRAM